MQWLLNAETSHPTSSPPHRLTRFFTTLHSALRNPSRAVLQFYPSSDDQIQLITSIAQKAGFGGGVVVDYPNSKKAKKVFLCLFVGGGGAQHQIPKGIEGEDDEHARFERRREKERKRDKSGKRKSIRDRDWILRKKEVSWIEADYACLLIISLVVSPAREGRGSKRFKIHWPQAQGHFLIVAVHYHRWTLGGVIPHNLSTLYHVRVSTNSSGRALTASWALFLMNNPWRAAMLTLLPSRISLVVNSSICCPMRSTTSCAVTDSLPP